ncbi:hypothetical protein CHISP_1962 [Chitinispirillum alkaliphilum]|nr:hypothetical protein CHISP_1962 [Chitinispirillum alkaliphilum]
MVSFFLILSGVIADRQYNFWFSIGGIGENGNQICYHRGMGVFLFAKGERKKKLLIFQELRAVRFLWLL